MEKLHDWDDKTLAAASVEDQGGCSAINPTDRVCENTSKHAPPKWVFLSKYNELLSRQHSEFDVVPFELLMFEVRSIFGLREETHVSWDSLYSFSKYK